MENQWRSILGSAGFYVTMAVCLLVVGVSGYFLLFDDKETPVQETELPAADAAAAAPAPEIEEPEEPPVVEAISPEPVTEAKPAMPEVEIDDTPVFAEAPRLTVSPLQGEVVTAFSVDTLVYNPTLEDWRTHDGVDISAELGTSVLAACSGTVAAVTEDALMGATVTIDHDGGYQTTYANLQATPAVEAGDSVSAGQIIGAVGATAAAEAAQGPHLHFSVTRDGDVVDPDEFLNG